MNRGSKRWLVKADNFYRAAVVLSQVVENPSYDTACVNAHDAAERYFKAVLWELGRNVPRTHDLESLLDAVIDTHADWAPLRADIEELAGFYLDFRYAIPDATLEQALRAIAITGEIRRLAYALLDLPA